MGDVHDIITCAKFQIEIFMGYDFTGGRIYDFSLILAWALQQCSATALPVIDKYIPRTGNRPPIKRHAVHPFSNDIKQLINRKHRPWKLENSPF